MYNCCNCGNIGGHICRLHILGKPAIDRGLPVIFMPTSFDKSESIKRQAEKIKFEEKKGYNKPYILAEFEVNDWNDALSPWPAPALGKGQRNFLGKADETLSWLLNEYIPYIEPYIEKNTGFPLGAKGLLGYSMGGLFAIWAMCNTDQFIAYGSCSGSLWYEGFVGYIAENSPLSPCSVYMSLGEREEFTRNPWFRKVGDATRSCNTIFEQSPDVLENALEYFPGGHSGDADNKLLRAQEWMLVTIHNA